MLFVELPGKHFLGNALCGASWEALSRKCSLWNFLAECYLYVDFLRIAVYGLCELRAHIVEMWISCTCKFNTFGNALPNIRCIQFETTGWNHASQWKHRMNQCIEIEITEWKRCIWKPCTWSRIAFGITVWGFGFRVWGVRFEVWGLRFQGCGLRPSV